MCVRKQRQRYSPVAPVPMGQPVGQRKQRQPMGMQGMGVGAYFPPQPPPQTVFVQPAQAYRPASGVNDFVAGTASSAPSAASSARPWPGAVVAAAVTRRTRRAAFEPVCLRVERPGPRAPAVKTTPGTVAGYSMRISRWRMYAGAIIAPCLFSLFCSLLFSVCITCTGFG